jgi:transcriptional regulator with XRE-family HTH domain
MPSLLSPIDQYIVDVSIKLRLKHNLNQEDIGTILGVTQAFISKVERLNHRAKYNTKHINLLADYFQISPREFLPLEARF